MTVMERSNTRERPDPAQLLIEEARHAARRRRRRAGTLVFVLGIVTTLVTVAVAGGWNAPAHRAVSSRSRHVTAVRDLVISPRFDAPDAIAASGPFVWVANLAGNSVTEFNADTGAQVHLIHARADAFHHPTGIAIQGDHVWVTNSNEEFGMGTSGYQLAKYSSVTELNSRTGSLVRVIKGEGLLEPGPVAVSGPHVWVVNSNASANVNSPSAVALVELNAANGSLVRLWRTRDVGMSAILNVTANASHVWLTNAGPSGGWVTELNARTGALVRVITQQQGDLSSPDPLAVSGSHLWVANIREGHYSLTELNSRNGSLQRVVSSPSDGFNGLLGVVACDGSVWVTNGEGYMSGVNTNSVTVLNAASGSLVRVIRRRADGLYGPTAIVCSGSLVVVLNTNTVSELSAHGGALIRVVR